MTCTKSVKSGDFTKLAITSVLRNTCDNRGIFTPQQNPTPLEVLFREDMYWEYNPYTKRITNLDPRADGVNERLDFIETRADDRWGPRLDVQTGDMICVKCITIDATWKSTGQLYDSRSETLNKLSPGARTGKVIFNSQLENGLNFSTIYLIQQVSLEECPDIPNP